MTINRKIYCDDEHPFPIPDIIQKILEKNDVKEDTREDISGLTRARFLYKGALNKESNSDTCNVLRYMSEAKRAMFNKRMMMLKIEFLGDKTVLHVSEPLKYNRTFC